MARTSTLRKTLRTREHQLLIEVLVAARERAGISQRDLAAMIKRPRSFIGRIEAGERRVDVIEFIEIARVLGQDPRRLLGKIMQERD